MGVDSTETGVDLTDGEFKLLEAAIMFFIASGPENFCSPALLLAKSFTLAIIFLGVADEDGEAKPSGEFNDLDPHSVQNFGIVAFGACIAEQSLQEIFLNMILV